MDLVLKEAGNCGRYQCLHLFFTQLPRFVAIWSVFFLMFGGYDPGWRCLEKQSPVIPSLNGSSSSSFDDDGDTNNSVFSSNVIENIDAPGGGTPYNGTCDVIDSCIDIEFNPTSRTIVTEFHLVCDKACFFRITILIQGVGYFLGPIAAGQIGERYGRKLSLYGSTLVISIFSGIAIFSTHWVMFAICYFFIGGATNSVIGIAPVFSSEFLDAKWRGYYGSIPVTSLALFLFTVVTLVLKDWIHVHILTCLLSLVATAGYFVVTESPRWLVMNGCISEAEKSVFRIAKVNNKPDMDMECFKRYSEATVDEESKRNYTFLDIFSKRDIFIFVLKFAIINLLFSATILSVTFGIRSLPGDYYTNAIEASCAEAVVVILTGPLCNIIGRRYTGLIYGSVGFVSSLSLASTLSLADEGYGRNIAIKIFAYLARSLSQAISVVAMIFSNELFPTVVRNVSAGLLRSVAGLGGLVAPFLTPAKDVHSLTVCFSIMCVCYAIIAVIFPSLPETNRRNLTDSLDQDERVLEVVE